MQKSDEEFKHEILSIIPNEGLLLAQVPVYYKRKFSEGPHLKKQQLTTFLKKIKELKVEKPNGHDYVTRVDGVYGRLMQAEASEVPVVGNIPTNRAKSKPDKNSTKASKIEMVDISESTARLSELRLDDSPNIQPRSSLSFLFRKSASNGSTEHSRSHTLLQSGDNPRSGLCLFGAIAPVEVAQKQGSSASSIFWGDVYDEEDDQQSDTCDPTQTVYLQTNEPFCAVCIGVQGAGKSHTMNVILENCMMPPIQMGDRVVLGSTQPLSGLVLHFDPSPTSVCESVGLNTLAQEMPHDAATPPNVVILVSPSFYLQRKEFYAGTTTQVYPLLFKWQTFKANQLRKLMRLSDSDAQLYVSTMLSLLRDYQRDNTMPTFDTFLLQVEEKCDIKGQSAPLKQRLELLTNFVQESQKNSSLRDIGRNLQSFLKSGTLVVADLTDPMMTADEACGVFQVLLEQFRGAPLQGVGKVVAFDEAHKYLSHSGSGCVELSNAIVDSVRLMRHDGLRVLISTQSPTTMPPELLELASVTILHRFQSAEWGRYLSSKVTLPDESFEEVKSLSNGRALVLSTKISRDLAAASGRPECIMVDIRPRLTKDWGASNLNRMR